MNAHVGRLAIMLDALFLFTGEYATSQHCFRGRPLPKCRSFWITETSVSYRLSDHETNHWKNRKVYEKLLYTWNVDLMHNVSRRTSLGGSIFVDCDDFLNKAQFGARFRYRRWFSRVLSVDVAPGIPLMAGNASSTRISVSVALNAADLIALSLRVDADGSGKTLGHHASWFSGVRFCSHPGLVVGIAGPVIAAMIWGDRMKTK